MINDKPERKRKTDGTDPLPKRRRRVPVQASEPQSDSHPVSALASPRLTGPSPRSPENEHLYRLQPITSAPNSASRLGLGVRSRPTGPSPKPPENEHSSRLQPITSKLQRTTPDHEPVVSPAPPPSRLKAAAQAKAKPKPKATPKERQQGGGGTKKGRLKTAR